MAGRGFLAAAMLAVCAPIAAGAAAPERFERGSLVLERVPETPPAMRDLIRQYQNTRTARFAGFSADGKGLFIATRFGETNQIHYVAAPLGDRRQLTFFDEPVTEIAPSPANGDLIAFARDKGGDENYQVYILNRRTGKTRIISDGKGRKQAVVWSVDGSQLAWSTTLDGEQQSIIVGVTPDPQDDGVVLQGDGSWQPLGWSPDGRSLLTLHYISAGEAELYVVDAASGRRTQINPSSKKMAYGDAEFSADGRSVYYTADEAGEFLSLYRYDLATGAKVNLTASFAWDIDDVEASPDGSTYAFVANDDGRSRLFIRDARNDQPMTAPVLSPGIVSFLAYAPDGRRLGFTFNTSNSPGDVYVWKVSSRKGVLERWTESEIGGLEPAAFVEPEFLSYPTFDSVGGAPRKIPAFIYRPRSSGTHPVVIVIHGGPEEQARPVFSSIYQFWANELGAAVIVPNVRGSTGYGKTYETLDNGKKREDSVKDIGALLDWIAAQPDLNKNRVMVYGASYGGYMALAAMTLYNDRLAGAVDIIGISDFVTFLENTAHYRQDLRRTEYGDERDPEMRAYFDSIAPLKRADRITKPIFIIQGLNDPRVPYTEAEQILAAVKKNGGKPWYMAAKDEGHGFQKKSNRDAMTEAVALFMQEVLKR